MDTLTLGLSLSLSGRYAAMGRQAAAGLELFVADRNAAGGLPLGSRSLRLALRCEDDASQAARCAEIYRSLCGERRVDLLLGPYSSGLCREAAPIAEAAGLVMLNHGGADDSLHGQGRRLTVSVLSPASEYLAPIAQLLAGLKLWRKRVAALATPSSFARAAIGGFEQACRSRPARWHGVRLCLSATLPEVESEGLSELAGLLARYRINAVVSAGSFESDTALMRTLAAEEYNLPVLGCVAAGVRRFGRELGETAEGIVGPSQWEEQLDLRPETGPTPADFADRFHARYPELDCDYPAAQAYAAGLLAAAALAQAGSLEQPRLREAFSDLRTTTLFGDFAIDRISGRQIGHKLLLVQWHRGEKVIIHPEAHADWGALEFPTGWRWLLAALSGAGRRTIGREDGGRSED